MIFDYFVCSTLKLFLLAVSTTTTPVTGTTPTTVRQSRSRPTCPRRRRRRTAVSTVAEATGCCFGSPGARAAAGELSKPLSGRRAVRDHSNPSRRRGLLLLGISGVCFCTLCVERGGACILGPPAQGESHFLFPCQRHSRPQRLGSRRCHSTRIPDVDTIRLQ